MVVFCCKVHDARNVNHCLPGRYHVKRVSGAQSGGQQRAIEVAGTMHFSGL